MRTQLRRKHLLFVLLFVQCSCSSLVVPDLKLSQVYVAYDSSQQKLDADVKTSFSAQKADMLFLKVVVSANTNIKQMLKNNHREIIVNAKYCSENDRRPAKPDYQFEFLRSDLLFKGRFPVTSESSEKAEIVERNYWREFPEAPYYVKFKLNKFAEDPSKEVCFTLMSGTIGSSYYSNTIRIPRQLVQESLIKAAAAE